MKLLLKLAWRNIWRNSRRTIITAASIMIAVFFALVMRSMQIGSYDNMVDNVVGAFTGYIQVHEKGYWEDKVIDNTFTLTDSLSDVISAHSSIQSITPRVESFALASSEDQTKSVMLIGIDPEKENAMTNLEEKVISGRYIENKDEILVAEKLAGYLQISVNDTLVLLSQGLRGASAAGKYLVAGILQFPSPELNKNMTYLPLSSTADFFSFPNENTLTSLCINLHHPDELEEAMRYLENNLDQTKYEVMSWREMMVELVQQIEGDQAGGYFMLGILYIIIGFGMFGTILMMMAERTKEFGVIIGIGMSKLKVVTMVVIEMLFIGVIGIFSGIVLSLPVILYFMNHPIRLTGEAAKSMEDYGIEPIVPFALELNIFANQTIVVMILIVIAIMYPLVSLYRMKEIEALRK